LKERREGQKEGGRGGHFQTSKNQPREGSRAIFQTKTRSAGDHQQWGCWSPLTIFPTTATTKDTKKDPNLDLQKTIDKRQQQQQQQQQQLCDATIFFSDITRRKRNSKLKPRLRGPLKYIF